MTRVEHEAAAAQPAARTSFLPNDAPASLRFPSAVVPDWSRERCGIFDWHPSRKLLRSLRDYATARKRGGVIGAILTKCAVVRNRFWAVVTGADIPLNSNIQGGFMLPHPNGVVVHPDVTIGPNCLLFQQVTVGTGSKPGVPRLGGHVEVGPGAKILGGVHIGDHAIIGANSVVLTDVPAWSVAVGVPASVRARP